jgi:membrane carboxypeptidase/penicillin-binding protein
MMQGVLARGTAQSIADLAPCVAGKTGTSDDENDAWFVGFTNEVTVAVWVGYDNANSKRRTLGGGATGGGVAVPIFEPVIRAVWKDVAIPTQVRQVAPQWGFFGGGGFGGGWFGSAAQYGGGFWGRGPGLGQ